MSGEELKERRQRLGLTQQDLARLLGVAEDTIERWESDKSRIPSRSVRMRVMLGKLQEKHGEMLSTGGGSHGWATWVAQCLEMGSIDQQRGSGGLKL